MTQENKRAAILEATLDLIVKHGFYNTPISQIASHSGVSTGIIYHYFDNKNDLIHQLYQQIKAQMGKALLSGDIISLPFDEQIRQVWLRTFHFHVQHPRQTMYIEQYENSPYYEPVDPRELNGDFKKLGAMIQAGVDAGKLKPFPLSVLSEMIFSVAVNIAKKQITGSIDLDEETLNLIAKSVCDSVLV